MPDFIKQLASSFEEIHYFVGGVSVGFILATIFWLIVFFVVMKIIRGKKNGK